MECCVASDRVAKAQGLEPLFRGKAERSEDSPEGASRPWKSLQWQLGCRSESFWVQKCEGTNFFAILESDNLHPETIKLN